MMLRFEAGELRFFDHRPLTVISVCEQFRLVASVGDQERYAREQAAIHQNVEPREPLAIEQ